MGVTSHTQSIATVLAACAVLLAVVPAVAVDGEILISQAKINAGGITPGDIAGFPATISRPGRYKLAGNLAAPGGINAIEVTANDVNIDLNGFTIRSNPAGPSDGIHAPDVVRLRVVNGTILGFGHGGVRGGDFAVVENLRLLSNATGVAVGQRSRVRNNTIANGGGSGVSCGQCLVERNVITGNLGSGVALNGGRSVVIGNVLVGNGAWGMTSVFEASGYGLNILVGNNGGGGEQVTGTVASQLHPNYCEPTCP